MTKDDLTNQKFGRLTVLGDVRERTKNGKVLWHCLCDCGTISFVRGDHLKNGSVLSCGCLNDENRHSKFKDLSGVENDHFKVIERSHSENQRVLWLCSCKHCGKKITLNSNQITQYTSCGCKRGASKAYMDSIRDPESLKTTRPTAKSSTGVRGVYFNKRKGSYQAFINVNKKPKYLGSSKDFEKAVALRKAAEEEYGYHDKE